MKNKSRIVNFVERNKYIRKNDNLPECDVSGNIYQQITEHCYYSGFFDGYDHFIISLLEYMFLYSSESNSFNRYNIKNSINFDIKIGQSELNFFEVNIIKPKYFLKDFSVAIGDSKYSDIEHIKNNASSKSKDSFNNNILSFIETSKKNDIIVRYGFNIFHNDPLSSRGYYLLVRKINGRFEVLKKLKFYVS